MLRRPPTRIELQAEDVAELKRLVKPRAAVPVQQPSQAAKSLNEARKDRIFGHQ